MLKNTDKYEDTTHFSYEDTRRKRKSPRSSNNKDLMVFVSVFIVGVLIILGFAKILSPNVDVAISVNDENSLLADDSDMPQSSIVDDRLKTLKQEDDGKKTDEEMFSPELDERVILPKQRRKTVGEIEAEKNNAAENNKVTEKNLNASMDSVSPSAKDSKPAAKPQAPVHSESATAKVVVGYYATEKQAEVAKSIIQDAGLGVVPIVKNMGGYYTLQVGSYSTREKAQQFANSLLKSNFPARVVAD